jgi:hypothetical protein
MVSFWYTHKKVTYAPHLKLTLTPVTTSPLTPLASPVSACFIFKPIKTSARSRSSSRRRNCIRLPSASNNSFAQINQQYPNLEEASGDYVEEVMRINPPVDPLFRAGEIGLGYDKERDRVVVFAKELLTEEQDPEEGGTDPLLGNAHPSASCSRAGAWKSLTRGRPMCPQCGQPDGTRGHFCPKKNGHLH